MGTNIKYFTFYKIFKTVYDVAYLRIWLNIHREGERGEREEGKRLFHKTVKDESKLYEKICSASSYISTYALFIINFN
jgi:hypothetical protein